MIKKYFLFFISILFLGQVDAADLNPDQKNRLMLITTIFENSFPSGTPSFQYGFIKNLHDGRGYTAGRVGFCTGTGDLLEVVEEFSKAKPSNLLVQYLPELRRLAAQGSADVSRLRGFVKDWQASARDLEFRKAQDAAVDRIYYSPAMEVAQKIGVNLPIGKAILYDTIIMHGGGTDPDSLQALVQRTLARGCILSKESSKKCVSEKTWLRYFLEERRRDMENPHNHATQAEWSQNLARPEIFMDWLRDGRYDQLDRPMHLKNYYFEGTIP